MPITPMLRTVYTTGQIAKILQVAPRTVSTWFDEGMLKGYRLPPPGQDRRIKHDDLVAFLAERKMPTVEEFLKMQEV